MNIIDILKGIENLALQFLLMLIYIPKTIYKIVKNPDWVTEYIDLELVKSEKFKDYLSPIILYLINTLLLFTFISSVKLNKEEYFIDELQSFNGLLFLFFPLIFAVIIELNRKSRFNRGSIVRNLYIQCYYMVPLGLSVYALQLAILFFPNLFDVMNSLVPIDLLSEDNFINFLFNNDFIKNLPFLLIILTLFWFFIVEIKFIIKELKATKIKALGIFFLCLGLFAIGYFSLNFISNTAIDNNGIGKPELFSVLNLPSTGTYTIRINSSKYSYGFKNENKIKYRYSIHLENKSIQKSITPFNSINNLVLGQTITQRTFSDTIYILKSSESLDLSIYLKNNPLDSLVLKVYDFTEKDYKNNPKILKKKYYEDSLDHNFIWQKSYKRLKNDLTYNQYKNDLLDTQYVYNKIELDLIKSGQYGIQFGHKNSSKMKDFYFEFVIREHESDTGFSDEWGNLVTIPTSGKIYFNESYSGIFDFNNWYFEGNKGDDIQITITPLDGYEDISFDVYDSNGKSINKGKHKYIAGVFIFLYLMLFGYAINKGVNSFRIKHLLFGTPVVNKKDNSNKNTGNESNGGKENM